MTLCRLAVTAAIFLVFSAAYAGPDDALESAIVNCSAQSGDKAQLACYNRIAERLKMPRAVSSPGSPAAPMAAPPRAPAPAARADFGKDNMPFQDDGPKQQDSISAHVAAVSFNFFHHFVVTLDNGQVWRQEDADAKIARIDKADVVTIKRGFLDSFHLAVEGRYGSFGVKRIK